MQNKNIIYVFVDKVGLFYLITLMKNNSKKKLHHRVLPIMLLSVVVIFFVGCSKSEDVPDPSPQPPYIPPVTHVYSDSSDSEAKVKEVMKDGTVVLNSGTKAIPKKGEVIVSGVTEAAPQGFLYRVEDVVSNGGNIEVKTSPAYLDEIIKDCHKKIDVPLEVVDVDASGLQEGEYVRIVKTRAMGLDKTIRLEISKKFDKEFDKTKHLSLEVKGYAELRTTFKLDIENWHFNEMNASIEGKLGLDVKGKLAFKPEKFEESFRVLKLPCKPVTIMAGYIPIVVTPKIVAEIILTAEGEFAISTTIIKLEGSFGYGCSLTKEPDPNTGKHLRYYPIETKNPFKDFTLKKTLENIKPEMGFSGNMKLAKMIGCNMGLYNTNDNMGIQVGPMWFAKIQGDFGLKWNDKNTKFDTDDFELKDKFDISTGLELSGKAKLVLKNPFDKKKNLFGGEADLKITLAEYKLLTGGFLFPVYSDLTVYPKEGVGKYKTVNFKVTKNWAWSPFIEEDYGFCYKEKGAKDKPWTYVSMKEKYPSSLLSGSVVMSVDYPVSKFLPNKTYEVRPYSKIMIPNIYLRRKGASFNMGDGVGGVGGTLEDVNGIEL